MPEALLKAESCQRLLLEGDSFYKRRTTPICLDAKIIGHYKKEWRPERTSSSETALVILVEGPPDAADDSPHHTVVKDQTQQIMSLRIP